MSIFLKEGGWKGSCSVTATWIVFLNPLVLKISAFMILLLVSCGLSLCCLEDLSVDVRSPY